MNIPEDYIIHDTRVPSDFKGVTICGYKRLDVINAFQNAMINNKLEESIRWGVELNSTGINHSIWSSLYNVYFKYIHVNHPKFLIYLLKRNKDYNRIIQNYPKKHELFTRNNQEIRNLLSELTSISTLTKKNNLFLNKSLPKINDKDFSKENIQKRMLSTNLDELNDFIYTSTTNEMKIAFNEILVNLGSRKGTFENCIYWYLWLEKIINNQKKEKVIPNSNKIIFETWKVNKPLRQNNDNSGNIEKEPFFDLWVYIIWDIILYYYKELDKSNSIYIKKLHNLYKKDFKITQISSKKYYIFIAFYIIKKTINWNLNLYPIEYLVIQINANINSVYKNIILNIESNLPYEMKNILCKKYYQIFVDEVGKSNKNTAPSKIKDTSLDKDLNTIVFSKHGGYVRKENDANDANDTNEEMFTVGDDDNDEKYENNNNNEEQAKNKNDLVYKNKTGNDVLNSIEEKKIKKLTAFKDFVTYKSFNIEKNIFEIENSNENNNYREIQINKKNKK